MGKASRKKKQQEKQTKQQSTNKVSPKDQLKAGWYQKYPILIFTLGFGVLMAIFYGFWFTDIFKENILNPVVTANVWLAGKLLYLFGYSPTISGPNLFTDEFSISVAQGCDALEPIAIYLSVVIIFPVAFRAKLPAILIGLPFLFVLNQVRIISLFFMGIYAPNLFDIAHIVIWQVVFIIIALLMLAYWLIWANKHYEILPSAKPVENAAV